MAAGPLRAKEWARRQLDNTISHPVGPRPSNYHIGSNLAPQHYPSGRGFNERGRSVSRQCPGQGTQVRPRSQSMSRLTNSRITPGDWQCQPCDYPKARFKRVEQSLVPPAPKDICPTLKKGYLCDSQFCKKDHNLEQLTDHELLLLVARQSCISSPAAREIPRAKDCRLATPSLCDYQQHNQESLTLNRLCEIAQAWASMTWEDIDDKQLRALLTLSAVLVRKHSKSQLSALCENHVRREALAQDQASIVLEVYQKLHSDKGGKFEAALWQHWDRGSLTLFIHAALRAGTTIPCESSAIVVASIMSLLSNSQNDSSEPVAEGPPGQDQQ
ncbi:minor nucleoprotein [Cuevavirus lloviuense]|uniref:Transcriptional activator VP30 n=1 Tax=Cuevavirus lloviuense TaxID=3052148 RepID=G8EFI6_9MONO|nr:minor nucleoprotein [Cuevavirus lloviuense]UJP71060.1 viral protein 30 [synthetic construct]AER23676.1 VP30 [Cuevavirus lloviuense]UJP71069.1 viral protein 30 [synthetic construct]UJP71078.1 viral protein 30 [synthetic construct]UJP71087.1 viral protein 30 [synthetic construct]